MLCCAFQAHAAMYVSTYQEWKESLPEQTRLYVSGVGEGIFWTNLFMGSIGDAPLYCQPERLALGAENYVYILEKELEERTDQDKDVPIEMTLLAGLIKTFPCA